MFTSKKPTVFLAVLLGITLIYIAVPKEAYVELPLRIKLWHLGYPVCVGSEEEVTVYLGRKGNRTDGPKFQVPLNYLFHPGIRDKRFYKLPLTAALIRLDGDFKPVCTPPDAQEKERDELLKESIYDVSIWMPDKAMRPFGYCLPPHCRARPETPVEYGGVENGHLILKHDDTMDLIPMDRHLYGRYFVRCGKAHCTMRSVDDGWNNEIDPFLFQVHYPKSLVDQTSKIFWGVVKLLSNRPVEKRLRQKQDQHWQKFKAENPDLFRKANDVKYHGKN